MTARTRRVTLIPGDGIGPSITDCAVRVVEAAGVRIEWHRKEAGLAALKKHGDPLPAETLASIRQNKAALKGPLETPIGAGFRSVNVALRKEFDLYVNLRPVVSFEGVSSKYRRVDLVVIRENTEEFYMGEERYVNSDKSAAEMVGRVTREGSERIARFAFEYARKNGRKKVTIVHKANIFKFTHGLFLETAYGAAAMYPDIAVEDRIADNMAMQLVLNPYRFDVILATNLIGDLLSDLCAGLAGGLGLAAGLNVGKKIVIAEAVHGTAPDIAGKNIANPAAIILSAALMLKHFGENAAARRIVQAVAGVLKEGRMVTCDIAGENAVTTDQMTQAIIDKLVA